MGGIVTSTPGDFGLPGLSPKITMKARKFLLNDKHVEYTQGIVIEKGTVDSASSPTTLLRPGMTLVRIETGPNKGKYCQFGHADSPANNAIKDAVILGNFVQTLGPDGTTADRQGIGIYHARVDKSAIIFPADATAKAAIIAILNLVQFVEAVA